MSDLRIALIGCGGMGKSEARLVHGIPGARLVACCDVLPEAARAFAEEMGITAYTDAAEVLRAPDVDAVLVATPNGQHTQVVCEAAAAGKHVFCEKPMAFTVAECDRMIEAARRHGVRLMVGHVLRLLPLFQRIIDIFDAGTLGRPVSADIARIGWFGLPTASYRMRRESCGGLLYDITVHEIDFLHRLLGESASVYALADTYVQRQVIDYEDTVHLLLRYKAGGSAHVFAALSSTLDVYRGTIVGERGTLEFDHRGRESPIRYRRAGEGGETVREMVADGENGYLRELRSFVEWVREGKEPLLTWREGRAAIAVVEAAYRSAASGQPQPVP